MMVPLSLLLRYRHVAAAVSIYLLTLFGPLGSSPRPFWAAGAVALLALTAFVTTPKPLLGRYARRRLMEGALALLLAIDMVSRTRGWEFVHLAAFPAFLVFVYTSYHRRELALLLVAEALVRSLGRFAQPDFALDVTLPFALLMFWTSLAMGFRRHEKRKRSEISERLHLYQREASTLALRSDEVQEVLRMDERGKVHLASMIRERERSFRNLLDILYRTFDPYSCTLYLFDATEETFLLKERLTEGSEVTDRTVEPAEGIFRALLRERETIQMVSASGELRGLTYYKDSAPVRTVLAMPVRSGDLLKGVLILDRVEVKPFTEEERETISQIAGQLAHSIDNAEALHAYFQLKEELAAFYAASNALNRSFRVEDVVETLLDSAHTLTPYDWGMVVLYDRVRERNVVAAERGDFGTWKGTEFACAPERGLISWVVRNEVPLHYVHFRTREGKTPLFHKQLKTPNVYDSVTVLPMYVKGESIGALFIASRANHFFSRSVRKMLEVITLHAAVSLKNARMVAELERLATTDGLTGLVNHRSFQETLAGELERSVRHPSTTSLLLIDIDHFKKFNDEYGHPVGDYVLTGIAGVLRKAVRKVDVVARYGGEEFAVILVNTTPLGARQMAQRIVQEVSRNRFVFQGLTLRVTVSVGSATYPDDAVTREELIERADRALYEAKRTGRNRTVPYAEGLGKMTREKVESRMIESAEEQVRRSVDHPSQAV